MKASEDHLLKILSYILPDEIFDYFEIVSHPNYDREDNDLKYRYIRMKGEATPNRISELQNLFEINRDNVKIR